MGATAIADKLEGAVLTGKSSLVGMAVKNRHYMPASADLVDGDTLVFDKGTRLPEAASLLVLPLSHGDQVIGALTLVSSRERQYLPQSREMLRVISHQVAVSVANARMYESMEQRATTDGLTGLTNHRAFQERMAQLHALCERSASTTRTTNQMLIATMTRVSTVASTSDLASAAFVAFKNSASPRNSVIASVDSASRSSVFSHGCTYGDAPANAAMYPASSRSAPHACMAGPIGVNVIVRPVNRAFRVEFHSSYHHRSSL